MPVLDRIIRIVHVSGVGIVAGDSFGRVHVLDDNLKLLRSSPRVRNGRPLYGLACADGWIVGRDRMGAVYRWSLDTLEQRNRIDPAHVCDPSLLLPGEEPSPVSARGIAIWKGRVYVTSGYHDQMLVINLSDFRVLQIIPNICGGSPLEWASVEHPTIHAISDKDGTLRFGHFDTMEFPREIELDAGNIHRVRYDARHDRFWCTQDHGHGETDDIVNGVVVVSSEGRKLQELPFARDDVEFVIFSPDYTKAYSGGFDGELLIFDNATPDLCVEKTIRGFPHQLSDVTINPSGEVYVLCQDGEIVKLSPSGEFICKLGFNRQAIWDIQETLESPDKLYLATDSGVSLVELQESAAGLNVNILAEHNTDLGFTRRLVAIDDGVVGISRNRTLFRMSSTGEILWSQRFESLLHSVAVSPDRQRILVGCNDGAAELNASSGQEISRLSLDGIPVWACTYLPDGRRVLGTRNGVLAVFHSTAPQIEWRFDQGDYPKRMWASECSLYVVGENGLKEITVGQGVQKRWTEILSNTVENAALEGDLVFAVSYGMQLAAYTYNDQELVGLVEELPDYPKSLKVLRAGTDRPALLVGCRTGMLSLYRFDKAASEGTFAKIQDSWLPRYPASFALEESYNQPFREAAE